MKIVSLNSPKSRRLISDQEAQILKSGLVVLKSGQEVGEHITTQKEEIIIILQGTATVIAESREQDVRSNHLIYIPENTKHNVKNNSQEILKYVYVVGKV